MKLLKCFKYASGLKVNLQKSQLFGVGVSDPDVSLLVRSLRCAPGSFPFMYLGLPVRANMRRLSSWSIVHDKCAKKLNTWKSTMLSMGAG